MAGLSENATLAVALAAGNTAEWVEQSDYLGPPPNAAAGVPLLGALRADYVIALRSDVTGRRAVVTFSPYDNTPTVTAYTVTINGTAYTRSPGSGEVLEDFLIAFASQMNAANPGEEWLASGQTTYLQIDGTVSDAGVDDDFSINASAAGGSGGIGGIQASPVSAVATFYAFQAGTGTVPGTWYAIAGGIGIAVDHHGLTDQLVDLGGKSRLYVQLVLTGHGSDGGAVTLSAGVAIAPSVVL